MVSVSAEIALRGRLITKFPDLDVAIEGVPYESDHDIYAALQFVYHPPQDPTYGPYYYRENIGFQIFVSDKLGIGTLGAKQLAENIREEFYKGLSLEIDGYRLHILRTPHISGAVVTSDRLLIPISIPVSVEVYKT